MNNLNADEQLINILKAALNKGEVTVDQLVAMLHTGKLTHIEYIKITANDNTTQ